MQPRSRPNAPLDTMNVILQVTETDMQRIPDVAKLTSLVLYVAKEHKYDFKSDMEALGALPAKNSSTSKSYACR
jgi:hypothetical protein